MSTIDPHLVSALHIRRMGRAAFDRDTSGEHTFWQTSSIDALLDGQYEGDLTFAELAAHGDFGIGTVQHLDGEMVGIDGAWFTISADGVVHEVPADTRTPFAVVCHFDPGPPLAIDDPTSLDALQVLVDERRAELGHPDEPVLAVRADGTFADLHLRSVAAQSPPYPPLDEVVAHQTEWHVSAATGSLVGFRFPVEAQGIDVAGFHLHFLADDRSVGGHVIDATLQRGTLSLDGSSDLHLEVPAGVRVGEADTSGMKGAVIRAVEGR